jgi:alpha-glucoside transport system substrate-binding protein
MMDFTGRTLGQYEILELIGHGGMANVYRAIQPSMGREVAIKVMPAHFLQDPTFLERFTREVRVIARLQHPRILPVHDFGEYEGMPYIVMAYMPGGTVADRIREMGSGLPLDETARLVGQIAEALDYAHSEGIIHRDFKPSNVLLDKHENAYLADFGIAKVTEATAQLTGSGIVGTPAYMAPEMAERGGVSPLIDVYALGVTLYQMLTGQLPYDAETPMGILMAHGLRPIPDARAVRPDLSPDTQMVIERAMAKDPTVRYQTAGDLAADLWAAAESRPISAPTLPAAEPTLPAVEPSLSDAATVNVRELEEDVFATEETAAVAATGAIAPSEPAVPLPRAPKPPSVPRKRPAWVWIGGGLLGLILFAAMVGGVLLLAGVIHPGGGGAPPPETEAMPAGEAAAPAEGEATPAGEEAAQAGPPCFGAEGSTVSIMAVWVGGEEMHFGNVLAPVLQECSITLEYEAVDDLPTTLRIRVEGGDPPDISAMPNVGAVREYAASGNLVPVDRVGANMANYDPSWHNLVTYHGQVYGIFVKTDIKSLVWYSPVAFEAAGYAVPETWEGFVALANQMVADGNVPFSMGMESGGVTGWTGTDTVQDILLRTAGINVTNGLITGETAWNDPAVVAAWEQFGMWAMGDRYTVGGADGTVSTHFLDAIFAVFADPPQAYMVRQSGFAGGVIASERPELEYGTDYAFFVLPGPGGATVPMQVGADVMAVFNDTPAVRAVVHYLTSAEGGRAWAASGFNLSPNNQVTGADYTNPMMGDEADALAAADGVSYDVGDLLPGGLSMLEFESITAYVNGGGVNGILDEMEARVVENRSGG